MNRLASVPVPRRMAETRFAEGLNAMHIALETAGVKNVAFECEGTSHEGQTWRRSLHHFAPRLFRY